ncbi:U2 small nuclear ribonucleoprotein auxiliary factor 35 kDa subunit-related protein 2 isoform X2 [Halyomorpha halys]|uniref:U2 small nuclear ribonucleoprotein auxiliary factor 35 kDa subunit-related protein 2 isoform X2 n=1 Tax=Halyomorpha halys TaxID=286706 RepID=UPI0006D518DE|nr:U2 small nuclear ribonucleoprotein auxiliary factor 35 kDa subunit-related protein 2 isoform X2 [Halyomorpha halys]
MKDLFACVCLEDRHKEWRKVAKKMRRKKIRSGLAQQRDELEMEEEEKRKMSPTYEKLIAEQKSLMIAAEEAEMKELEEKLRKWQEEEERVREETVLREALLKELEEKNEKARIEKIEAEKQLIEEEVEKKKRITDALQHFASGIIDVLPDDMLVPLETQPGKEKCQFFHKVAACKFWDACSRNHVRPAVSKVLLFPGFYTHFSMSVLVQSEYDTDMSLEFDEKETYSHFVEFYQDIRSEFENYGRLTNLLVCCNRELHLRGNVYVAYATEREAMTAFLKFNGRYYAGRVISCLFVNIPSWKSAVCGLHFKQKCPKGDACNFLHVFKDPGPPFYKFIEERSSSSDEWRWSVSPENGRSNDIERKGNDKNRNRRKRRSRSPDQRRSRSSERQGLTTSHKHKSSRMKGFSKNCKKRQNELKRKSSERSGRSHSMDRNSSHSRDRNRSHPSDNRHPHRDKYSSGKLKSNRTRTNRRSRSRSLSRVNKRKRGEESTHRGSSHKNNSQHKERSTNRSSSRSSGSSDDESSSS